MWKCYFYSESNACTWFHCSVPTGKVRTKKKALVFNWQKLKDSQRIGNKVSLLFSHRPPGCANFFFYFPTGKPLFLDGEIWNEVFLEIIFFLENRNLFIASQSFRFRFWTPSPLRRSSTSDLAKVPFLTEIVPFSWFKSDQQAFQSDWCCVTCLIIQGVRMYKDRFFILTKWEERKS